MANSSLSKPRGGGSSGEGLDSGSVAGKDGALTGEEILSTLRKMEVTGLDEICCWLSLLLLLLLVVVIVALAVVLVGIRGDSFRTGLYWDQR